jgi:hypothetical protein
VTRASTLLSSGVADGLLGVIIVITHFSDPVPGIVSV